ncbi:MAG: protein kinase [Luteolibacter sp.]
MDTLSQLRADKLAGSKRLDLSCGLTEFPREIFDLADSLEVLNLSGNRLSELPEDFGRLHKLRILFCSENEFTRLPAVIGGCGNLSMVGFKSNRIETVDESAFPKALRWLILTDNRIARLPSSIGNCPQLQKLMLAGNHLVHLPDAMAACVNLELIRLAANRFRSFPEWLFELPRLSWLALGGNPWSQTSCAETMAEIDWAHLRIGEKIGEGASGVIHQAHHGNNPAAVKIFKGGITSDGLPEVEMATSLAAGRHPNLIDVRAKISNHPDDRQGLVMSLIDSDFVSLAGPPSLDSCTRDVYAEGCEFPPAVLLRIVRGLASAVRQLHNRGIIHGDFYAHNVLLNQEGDCVLGDFGAASFYPQGSAVEPIEVRAFGCLLGELLLRCPSRPEELWKLQRRCISEIVSERPGFAEIVDGLNQA